jgi:hypothetical protein
MRRQFAMAMESHGSFNNVALEDEEMIEMSEEASKQNDEVINSDLPELDEMADKADALEDLAVIADGIEEASPGEIALVRNVADMAVAGTDVNSEEIISEEVVPLQVEVSGAAGNSTDEGGSVATESYIGRRISTEGIAEIKRTAKRIYDAIIKFLKDIWNKIEKFFYNIFGTIPLQRKRIEALKKRANAIEDDGSLSIGTDKLEIVSSINNLSINYVPVTTGRGFVDAVDILKTKASDLKSYLGKLTTTGDSLADIISGFNAEKPEETITKMSEKAVNDTLAFPGLSVKGDSRWPDHDVSKSTDLLGNVVILMRKKKTTGDLKAMQRLDAWQSMRVSLVASSEKGKTKEEFSLAPLSTSEVIKLCDAELALLDEIEKIKRGSELKNLVKTKDKITSAISKAESSYNKLKESKNDDNSNVTELSLSTFRTTIDFARSYTSWSAIAMQYISHCTSTLSSVNAISAKSLSSYSKKDK